MRFVRLIAALAGLVEVALVNAETEQQNTNLTVSVTAHKSELVLGEPLFVAITITNRGEEAIRLYTSGLNYGAILISRDNQERRVYEPGSIGEINFRPVLLPPGQALRGEFTVLRNVKRDAGGNTGSTTEYAFPEPGEYSVEGRYANRVSFSGVTVSIKAPVGDDLQVWNQLRDMVSYRDFLQSPSAGFSDAIALATFASIVERYPSSLYSHYLALALAKHHLSGYYATTGKPIASPEVTESRAATLEYSEMAATMTQIPALREEAMLYWADLAGGESASEIAHQALQQFPNGRYKERFQFILERAAMTKWIDPVDIAGKALETMGYDTTMIEVSDTRVAEMEEYAFKVPEHQRDAGTITYEQMRTEQARRYKEWVTNNLAPVNRPADTTPPQITCPAAMTLGCDLSLTVPVSFSATATDNVDTNVTVTCLPASGSGFKVGSTTVTCTAKDASNNSTNCTFTVTRAALGFTGFLSPIGGADGTGGSYLHPMRTFKLGSKIPVKFTSSCSGSAVTNGVHTLQVIKWSNETTSEEPLDASPADAATTGNEFRLTGDEWHYNLDTAATAMTVGTWEVRATLSDGSTHSAFVALK